MTMKELLLNLWEQYPVEILKGLAVFDLILFVFITKKMISLFRPSKLPQKPKGIEPLVENKMNSSPVKPIEALPQKAVENVAKTVFDKMPPPVKKPVEVKPIQTFAQEELKNIKGVKHDIKLAAIRNIAVNDKSKLFEIKRLLDDKDDAIALYSLRAILKVNSSLVGTSVLQKVLHRGNRKRFLLISCLKRIAEGGNPKALTDIVNADTPDWIYVASLKILFKMRSQDLIPLLMTAQEQKSEVVKKCADELLAKIEELSAAENKESA